jgi:type IV secretion system protein VirB5
MPLANSLSGLVGGQTSGNAAATTYYNQNHIYTAPAGTEQSTQLNQNAQGIANIEGIASTNLSAIEARLQQLPDLEADLNSATSITQVSAINGRIAAESQFVQAQQAQAANLQVLASEQQASQQQQEQEAHQESDTNLLDALNSASP